MRTNANLAKTTDSHTHQSFLYTGDNLAFAERLNMVNEKLAVLTTDPIIGDSLFCLNVIYRDFVALIQKNSAGVNNRVSDFRCGTRTLLIF